MLPPHWRDLLIARPHTTDSSTASRRAATAVVIASAEADPHLLFLERSRREGDPWSGQMSFPGGHIEESDSTSEETARRETLEEVGFEIGTAITRLDDLPTAGGRPTIVTPWVFESPERGPLVPEPSEVARADWIALRDLTSPDRFVEHELTHQGIDYRFPGIENEGRVIWGLTYRTLWTVLVELGIEIPKPKPRHRA